MPDYSKGRIYKLVCDDPELIYYGSTIQKYLSKRFHQHKEMKCSSKALFEAGGCKIILVENYPCKTKDELIARERYYIENFKCVNKIVCGRTQKEMYQIPEWREAKKKYNRERYYRLKNLN